MEIKLTKNKPQLRQSKMISFNLFVLLKHSSCKNTNLIYFSHFLINCRNQKIRNLQFPPPFTIQIEGNINNDLIQLIMSINVTKIYSFKFYKLLIFYSKSSAKLITMQAVGNQVIVAILLMIAPIALIIIYYWNSIKQLYLHQIAVPEVPLEEPHDREELRRERNDNTCAICLTQPKQLEVSSTCGHSFCGNCLFQIYERNEGTKVKCPLCRNDMSVLFKCFHLEDHANGQVQELANKIRNYNRLFDDNRPLLRRILEFPYVLKRLIRYVFSVNFLIFFLRNIYFIRLIFMGLFYLILPIDILPESLVGVIGLIDDIFIFILLTSYIVTIVAVQYYRAHH